MRWVPMMVVITAVGALASAAAPAGGAAPTRLVAGPQIFRVSGADDGTRYLMIFRLNHYPGPRYGAWRGTKFGSYQIEGRPLFGEVDELDRYDHFCIQYTAYSTGSQVNEELDRIKVGHRVEVTLTPGDTAPDGSWTYGRTYHRRPTLRTTVADFHDPRARAALKKIGCLRKNMIR